MSEMQLWVSERILVARWQIGLYASVENRIVEVYETARLYLLKIETKHRVTFPDDTGSVNEDGSTGGRELKNDAIGFVDADAQSGVHLTSSDGEIEDHTFSFLIGNEVGVIGNCDQ